MHASIDIQSFQVIISILKWMKKSKQLFDIIFRADLSVEVDFFVHEPTAFDFLEKKRRVVVWGRVLVEGNEFLQDFLAETREVFNHVFEVFVFRDLCWSELEETIDVETRETSVESTFCDFLFSHYYFQVDFYEFLRQTLFRFRVHAFA